MSVLQVRRLKLRHRKWQSGAQSPGLRLRAQCGLRGAMGQLSLSQKPTPCTFSSASSQSRQEIYALSVSVLSKSGKVTCLLSISRILRIRSISRIQTVQNCLKSVQRVYMNSFVTWTVIIVFSIYNKWATSQNLAVFFSLRNSSHKRILLRCISLCPNYQNVQQWCSLLEGLLYFRCKKT